MAGGYDMTPVDPLDVLRAQLVDLKARVSELERPTGTQTFEVLANQAVPAAATGSGSNFTVTTSETTFATATVPVPDGYTRALVYAGGGFSASQNLTGGRLFCHVRIDGVDGPDTIGLVTTSWPYSSLAAFSTRSLSGLTGGNVTVQLRAYFSSGSTDPALKLWNTASLAVQVLFLR